MGASGSKKKKNKGSGGFLEGLTDAAEGATSSITKAIEDTSNQVTSKIDTTTKSVTDTIDNTSKRLSGTAQNVQDGVAKHAEEAAGTAAAVTDSFKESLDNTAKSSQKAVDDLNKKITDTTASVKAKVDDTKNQAQKKADELAASAKESADQAQKKSEEMKEAAANKASQLKNSAEETANNLKTAGENMKNSAESKAKEAKKQLEDSANEAKKQLEASANEAKEKAESKANEAKKQLEDSANEAKKKLESSANEAKGKLENKAKELEDQANDAKKQLEDSANAKKKQMEDSANAALEQLDNKAKQLEDAANEKKKQLETAANDAKAKLESKANEAKGEFDSKKGEADSAINKAKSTRDSIKGGFEATAAGVKKEAEDTIAGVRKSVEKTTEDLKSTSGQVIDDVKSSGQKVSDGINKSISDAKSQGEAAKANLSELAENTAGALKGAAQGVTDTLTTAVTTAVGGAVSLASETATKTVKQVGESVKKSTDGVTKSLTTAVQSVSGSVTGAAGAAASGLMGKAGAMSGALAQGAANISKTADDFTKSIEDQVVEDESPVLEKGPDNRTSFTVCKENEMKDGEMKVFKLNDDGSVLIVRENGVYSALGTKCSHYGAPLVKGVLHKGKVRCPWHGACFKTSSGDIEESPGLDSIPCYEVVVEDGDVKVLAPLEMIKHHVLTKTLCRKNDSDARTFVVIGGGGAGESCAETLRQEGFSGRLVMISKESDLPYDRPKLSKALSSTGKDIALRSEEYFKEGDIEVLLEHEVISIDTSGKAVKCGNGTEINYNSLMIATGGRPLTLNVPGNELENICYLRTPADANKIVSASKDKKAVIIGTSFIGMEVAAYLHGKAKSVTVVGRSKYPFDKIFGQKVGERLHRLFVEKDVQFQLETEVEEFKGDDGKLTSVVLKNGETLDADVCIVGIGVRPSTDILENSGLDLNDRKYVVVDEFLQTSVEGVFAGGDIVQFPLTVYGGDKVSIGHWQMAQSHGRTAAFNMLGKKIPLHTMPFFWASMFGKSLRCAGNSHGVDDFIIDGDLESMKFVVYCCKGEDVIAIAAMGRDPIASQFASFIAEGGTLKKSEIESNPKAWISKMS